MGKFVIKEAKRGPKFDLKATNGQVIGTSQVFKTLRSCVRSTGSVTKAATQAGIEDQTVENFETVKHPKFVLYTDKAGEIRFKLLARNGQNVLASEGYTTKKAALNGVESVKKNCVDAAYEVADVYKEEFDELTKN